MYTDAGVCIKSGKAKCGIIVQGGTEEMKIKVRLPTLDPTGATTGEILSLKVILLMLKRAGLQEKQIAMYNDNTEAIGAIYSKPNFQELVGNNGWAKGKLWEETVAFTNIQAEWSKDDSNRDHLEHGKVLRNIKRCHDLAHEQYMDVAFEDTDLSINIGGKIKCNKLGSTTRELIGEKYVQEMLKRKYDSNSSKVYLKERRKVIKTIDVYVGKTANGLNLHSALERYRGNKNAVCPVCGMKEDWLHVAKCCSSGAAKTELLQRIKEIQFEEVEKNDAAKVEAILRKFLTSTEFEECETKMLLRGWIETSTPKREISVWATKVIRTMLTFYYQCWTRRNQVKFGTTKQAGRLIQKDLLLDKINLIYDMRGEIFERDDEQYINILFKRRKEDWKEVSIKNMQAWIDTVQMAMKRRSDDTNYSFDIQEYLQFEQVTAFERTELFRS